MRRAFRLGLLTPSEALRSLPEELALLKVADLLWVLPRETRRSLDERLRDHGIGLSRPLDSLSLRQRNELASLLAR